ncbi:hypothetical protein, partial [Streptomyces sp. F001]|uniref:hypothetical protein n=1 Tax=Streptomyces sp. F001 TaxID=1510026 RepID=UPI0013EE7740
PRSTELERLDRTVAELEASEPGEVEWVRARQEASWQARFEMLLESLDEPERGERAAALQRLLAEHVSTSPGGVTAGAGGVAAGGNITNRAENGSIAAAVVHGGAHIGSPPKPDPIQG